MAKTATFSNGYTDTYKGKRDVRGAWMVFERSTGIVLRSGHSNDVVTAQKTGEQNASDLARGDARQFNKFEAVSPRHPNRFRLDLEYARECGFDTVEAAKSDLKVRIAEARRNYGVEVIAI